MVLLTVTPAAKEAIDHFNTVQLLTDHEDDEDRKSFLERISDPQVGSPVEHEDLISVSAYLVHLSRVENSDVKKWRLDSLLRGASVCRPLAPAKPQPTPEYKALMQRLQHEEEQRQYERMVNAPPARETFGHKYPDTARPFNPATAIGQGPDTNDVDDVTFADVNRQMALIINVLVSIIACSVAIWIAARRWSVPQRLGLSMSGSCLVAVAEVVIYMGYIRRIKDAKEQERKVIETKEILESWVLDGTSKMQKVEISDGVRYRKGKHR